jgi:lipopolysaccharide transport system ATP-binding protein
VIELDRVAKRFRIPHENRRTAFDRLVGRSRFRYETVRALEGVSLRIGAGEFVGVLGRNGSGKSTLLRVLAGIYTPDEGHAAVHGSVAPVLDLGVGFQPDLAVRDNVVLYGVLLGIPRADVRGDLTRILAEAGVERFRDAKLQTLSTGLRMRLAFTLAMRAEAEILLIDEVLAVGDEAFQRKCVDELARRRARGTTALLVSHDSEGLAQLCDRIVVLREGEVWGDGPPREMVDLYRSLVTP